MILRYTMVYLKYSKIQWLMIDTINFPCLTAINWGSKRSKPLTDRQTDRPTHFCSSDLVQRKATSWWMPRSLGQSMARSGARRKWIGHREKMIEWVHCLHASSQSILMFWIVLEHQFSWEYIYFWYIWENSVFHFKCLERVTTQVDDCRFGDDPLTDWWSSWVPANGSANDGSIGMLVRG